MGGVARRNWARNDHAIETAIEYNRLHAGTDHITIPYLTDEDLVKEAVQNCFNIKNKN
ncbi:Urocanate hydratase [Streptococcus sp. ZB199]|nr:Urocanate hydratase [Streptococcus sp. ZB199]